MNAKEWKAREGVTYNDLAEKTGFSAVYLHEVIEGKKRGSIDVWDALAEVSGGEIKRVPRKR